MDSNIDELAELLGPADAAELCRWAGETGRTVQAPSRLWERAGHSGARLAQVYITDPDLGTQLVVIKILKATEAKEPSAHRWAISDAPANVRHHFTRQVYDPLRLSGGRLLTFQEPAGHSPDFRSMSELPDSRITAACRTLTRFVLSEWNTDFTIESREVVSFLRDESAAAASVFGLFSCANPHLTSSWMLTEEGDRIPNPVRLLAEDSLLAGECVDLACGYAHRDMHCGNVLIAQRHGVVQLKKFVLIDLLTYTRFGQLGRDPVTLLLSATTLLLPELSESQRQLLLPLFVTPDSAPSKRIPPIVIDTLRSVYDTAEDLLKATGTWRIQYLMSVVAQGLIMASFEDLGPRLRWWFFRLAGHAALELLREFNLSLDGRNNASMMTNPFDSALRLADLFNETSAISQRGREAVSAQSQ